MAEETWLTCVSTSCDIFVWWWDERFFESGLCCILDFCSLLDKAVQKLLKYWTVGIQELKGGQTWLTCKGVNALQVHPEMSTFCEFCVCPGSKTSGSTDLCYTITWTELVMVLRAKIVAQSFTVDWLSKAPWVSISTTATCGSICKKHTEKVDNPWVSLHFSGKYLFAANNVCCCLCLCYISVGKNRLLQHRNFIWR